MIHVSFSGGADSTAVAILLHEQGEEYELLFADTGAELPETYHTIQRVSRRLEKPLVVVGNGTYYQWLVTHNFLIPGVFQRWCTRILKHVPLQAYSGEDVRVAIGYRADEPKRIERLHENQFSPLVNAGLGKEEVLALCAKYDLLNPCYKWRRSTSCWCCQFQSLREWRALAEHHPSLFALAESWEEESRLNAEVLGRVPSTYLRPQRGELRWLKDLRQAQEDQLSMFEEPKETACAICRW